jgi:SAM-dependent MidA family methyltransferase
MSEIEQILRAEIAQSGPIPFSRFMEAALYTPGAGYYRSPRDPFGGKGDFYTAEQLQPTFGLLIRRLIAQFASLNHTFVEVGCGRGEMEPFFNGWSYVGLDIDRGSMPERFDGFIFANEFFDALPVDVVENVDGVLIERRVDWRDGRFRWVHGPNATATQREYVSRYAPELAPGCWIEVNLSAEAHLRGWSRRIAAGHALIIDYGYSARELIRFPEGTLMSYRGHRADEDVLIEPGSRDITAHVNFTALRDQAERAGWRAVWLEPLSTTLLRAGESDQFQEVLQAGANGRGQLKQLLYGMGERFRTLLLARFDQ